MQRRSLCRARRPLDFQASSRSLFKNKKPKTHVDIDAAWARTETASEGCCKLASHAAPAGSFTWTLTQQHRRRENEELLREGGRIWLLTQCQHVRTQLRDRVP